ncbi:MAG: methionine biosynthesis protein MetW [Magnetovibrio sp.]|nr:methionine biosynthesis protein MetW [Magnetovibrio sp.]|tara:strand:+ start:3560 stop:4183 length:624 start_codon:yes stop_codon:yes gene_type:complete
MSEAKGTAIRVDLQIIANMISEGSRVLDVGCGNGILLDYLARYKKVDGRGIELSTQGVNSCVSAGLSVVQGDANTDLKDYPNYSFDYVVLSQTLQAMNNPRVVLEQLLRIGRRAIISFPNFAHWRVRYQVAINGCMPVSPTLPYQWYETPNIHFCTIKDFGILCKQMGIIVERSVSLDRNGSAVRRGNLTPFFSNLFGEQAVFLLKG